MLPPRTFDLCARDIESCPLSTMSAAIVSGLSTHAVCASSVLTCQSL